MSDELKKNLLSSSQWLRILYMALFGVVCWLLGIILIVLVVFQALFALVTGKDNENLRKLGGSLSLYFYQILLFVTYRSGHKPFPFAAFPDPDEGDEAAAHATPATARAERPAHEAPGDDVFADISFTDGRGTRTAGARDVPTLDETGEGREAPAEPAPGPAPAPGPEPDLDPDPAPGTGPGVGGEPDLDPDPAPGDKPRDL